MTPARAPSVVVAVLTHRRPGQLRGLLPVLVAQAQQAPAAARVVVVDNDPAGSAREVALAWEAAGVRYLREPRPGIAAGRNRALAEAADADAVVFVDDDEVPRPQWLARLVAAWREWGCAAVAGPVVSLVPDPLDPWLAATRTFARPRRPSGTRLPGAATNNLLLDVAGLRAAGLRFDDAFGLTGGSDTLLTRQLVARGGEIRWCDEAEVAEVVPPERLTRGFALRRHLRTGTTWSRVHLVLAAGGDGRARRAGLLARGAARTAGGLALAARGVAARSVADRARGACDVASGAGLVLGALGYGYPEYRRPRRARRPGRAAARTDAATTSR